jgi:hypothetical protein
MDNEFDLQKMLFVAFDAIKILKRKPNNRKSILQFDLNGSFICKYKSVSEASIKTGICVSYISRICNKKKKSKKYIFKHEAEDIVLPEEPLNKLLDFL